MVEPGQRCPGCSFSPTPGGKEDPGLGLDCVERGRKALSCKREIDIGECEGYIPPLTVWRPMAPAASESPLWTLFQFPVVEPTLTTLFGCNSRTSTTSF